jgi:hypothetical protein
MRSVVFVLSFAGLLMFGALAFFDLPWAIDGVLVSFVGIALSGSAAGPYESRVGRVGLISSDKRMLLPPSKDGWWR